MRAGANKSASASAIETQTPVSRGFFFFSLFLFSHFWQPLGSPEAVQIHMQALEAEARLGLLLTASFLRERAAFQRLGDEPQRGIEFLQV